MLEHVTYDHVMCMSKATGSLQVTAAAVKHDLQI